MAQGYSLKDQLFNPAKVGYLCGLIANAAPKSFDRAALEAEICARLPELELKARIDWIASCLDRALPGPFEALAQVIEAALPPPLDPGVEDGEFGDFIFAPLGELVVRRGMATPERALDLLEALTQRFSMEYAIRPFLNAHEERVLQRMEAWCAHPSTHVRRLVSEGTRPRLPWGMGIRMEPRRALPLLDRLHADRARYVTRSLANHLNDLCRAMPDEVLARLDIWERAGKQTPAEMAWIRSHALRGLVKAGDPRALAALGFRADAPVRLASLTLEDTRLAPGERLDFTLTLEADDDQEDREGQGWPVLVDYIIAFHRPGATPARRVMKLGRGRVSPGDPLTLAKRYRLPKDATTLRLHPGPHRLEIQVNGTVLGGADFEVT